MGLQFPHQHMPQCSQRPPLFQVRHLPWTVMCVPLGVLWHICWWRKFKLAKQRKFQNVCLKKNKKTCTNFLWLIIIPQVLFPDNHTSSSFSGQTMNIHYPRKLHLTPSNPHVQRNHKHIHRPHTILISHSVSWLLVHYDSVHINYNVILLRLHYMHYDATPHKHL